MTKTNLNPSPKQLPTDIATVRKNKHASAATETVDLSLSLLQYLVDNSQPVGVTDLAKAFEASKATVYRHLQALVKHGFAQQNETTNRYEPGIKLLQLGEALRERFTILARARNEMALLREATDQAVSLSTFVNDEVIILELLQGRTMVEFGVKAGTKMDFHATAHGRIALAFGPPRLLETLDAKPLKKWTPKTITSPLTLKKEVIAIRKRGWATAANGIVWGVNGLAAPIFDHRNKYVGAIAIIGSIHLITAKPPARLISLVTDTANRVSRALGNPDPHS